MRELKHRAYDKINKKMIYFENLNMGTPYKNIHIINSYDVCEYFTLCFGDPIADECHEKKIRNINDFELMQYIGVKDSKEKEIFEGDIVKQDDIYWIVDYCNSYECCRYVLMYCESLEKYEAGGGNEREVDNWGSLEVVGNIHENSELINGGQR